MNRTGIMEYWNIGKQRLPWSNLAARAAWNNSGIMDGKAVAFTTFAARLFALLRVHHSTIPLFQYKGQM
jgi:hypothetical protein